MGKEQKQNTPRARTSSPKLFTLKALGSSKDRAPESWLDCLLGSVPEVAAASVLHGRSGGREACTRRSSISADGNIPELQGDGRSCRPEEKRLVTEQVR